MIKKFTAAFASLQAYLFANSALFQTAQTKVDSFNTGMVAIGVAILTLSIMVAAIGMFTGYFSKGFCIKLAAGGIIFGMASTLAGWFIN